jgi:nitroreductase
MADNYLEKKMEEYRSRVQAPSKSKAPTLNQLLLRNRSHRSYDPTRAISLDELRRIINVNTRIPSAHNQQCLRFRAVTGEENSLVLPHIKLGGALPHLHLPAAGNEPSGYIIVCSTAAEDRWVDIDLGISAQSMLLKATEMKLNGICIGAFNTEKIAQALSLSYPPLLIIAIGKGNDNIRLIEINEEDSHTYYRKDGIHYVPKVKLNDLIIT